MWTTDWPCTYPRKSMKLPQALSVAVLVLAGTAFSEPQYDLLLRGGHVIDPKNKISEVRDVAIRDGKIAAVEPKIDPAKALKTVDVGGLYVTPGLVDIHVHVFAGTGERRSYAGDNSVYPDGFTFRSGVTAVADAGCAGWRNFDDFKAADHRPRPDPRLRVPEHRRPRDARRTRFEQNVDDMEAKPTAEMAHAAQGADRGDQDGPLHGPDFIAGRSGRRGGHDRRIPVMVDFGRAFPQKSLAELLAKKLRPGDIYTHVYSGLRGELDPSGHANPALFEGRKRGVIFDVGHGGGSFTWRVAVPIVQEGFLPDSISTDLHTGSHERRHEGHAQRDEQVPGPGAVARRGDPRAPPGTRPARSSQEQLGNLSVGSPADVAVLRLEQGDFGFLDVYGARLRGDREADLRDDPARRQDRLRAQRPVSARLDHAAQGLPVHGRPSLGRQPRAPTAAWTRMLPGRRRPRIRSSKLNDGGDGLAAAAR